MAPAQTLLGWGWFVLWDLGFLAARPVASVDPVAPQSSSEWFVVVPVVRTFTRDDQRFHEFLARHGPAVFDLEGNSVYRIAWP